MPTPKQVEDILRDCIAADPSLRKRENELRPIIAALLEARPDTRFSKDFADRLRSVLSDERQRRIDKMPAKKPSLLDFMKRLPIAIPVAGSLALIAVFAILLTQKPVGPNTKTLATAESTGMSGVQISKVADGAFGSLANTTVNAVQQPMADGFEDSHSSAASGTATISAPSTTPAPSREQSGGGGSTAPSSKMAAMMPIQDPVNYRYVYDGELPAIDAKIDIFRHVKGLPANGMLSSFGSVTAGIIDGSRFASGSVQSFNVIEDREYGYMINLDAVEGLISLNQNWQRWPHPESKCRDEACYLMYQITPEQVPADDVVIGIAEDFIKEYDIDRAALGEPSANGDWRIRPMGVAADTRIYAPDVVSVTYPFLIDGKPAQDENGNPNGVTINVNVREKKVDGLWGLTSSRYERSSYPAETDSTRLMKFVSGGGLYAGYNDPSFKTVDIALGTPEIVLTSYWKDNGDGTGQNLFVPALRFPVLNPPADQPWFRKAVTVPLSKDLLDQADAQAAQNGGGVPTPIMYMKEDVK